MPGSCSRTRETRSSGTLTLSRAMGEVPPRVTPLPSVIERVCPEAEDVGPAVAERHRRSGVSIVDLDAGAPSATAARLPDRLPSREVREPERGPMAEPAAQDLGRL